MKTICSILEEVQALGPMRAQKIWGRGQALIFEFYTGKFQRIYLICDYSREHFSFHLQLQKPEGPKTITPIMLAARKYFLGETLKFEIISGPKIYMIAKNFTSHEISLVFDLSLGLQVGIFNGITLLAHSGQKFVFPSESVREHVEVAHDDLHANFSQAEIYNKNIEKHLNQQYFLSRKQELSNKLKKLNTLENNLNTDLNKCLARLEREHEAELLRVNLHLIKKGQTQVALMDYTCEQPQEKTVLLDPRLSPKQSLEKIFNYVKKARRGISIIRPRLTLVQEEISALKESLAQLVLGGPESMPAQSENTQEKRTSSKTKLKAHKRLPYRIFISSDKIPIWVGKSAKDNDDLTLHHARGKEWWFHVQQGAGSHVVVKCSNDALLPNTLLEAAMLAAHFSSFKHDSNPEIIYTRIKNIKKPKGFPPGRVLVEQEKILIIRMDHQRLTKLCAP